MSEILIPVLALAAVFAGLVALARYARHDSFAGPGIGHRPVDELDPRNAPRVQRIRSRRAGLTWPAMYPSYGRTRTS